MRLPSHATAVAYAALFVALSGTAYAAIAIPANSVGTAQLKAGAVTLTKIAASAQTALRGQNGPPGPVGPAGPSGPPGQNAAANTSSTTVDLQQSMGVAANNLGRPITVGSLVLTPACSLNDLRLSFGTSASSSTIVFSAVRAPNNATAVPDQNTYFAHGGEAISSQPAYNISDNGAATTFADLTFFARDAGGKIVAGVISLEVSSTQCALGGYATPLN